MVLGGALTVLKEHAPVVAFEQSPSDIDDAGGECIRLLESQGLQPLLWDRQVAKLGIQTVDHAGVPVYRATLPGAANRGIDQEILFNDCCGERQVPNWGGLMTGISVIITCYNLESYIGLAIESVFSQRFDGDLEVLVVDDCSSDGSASVISRYSEVTMLSTPTNSGVLLATILGLRAARHEIVAFLDGDDTWREDKLGALARAFQADVTLGLVTHDLRYIDSDGAEIARASRPSKVIPPEATPCEVDRLIRDGILKQGDYVWLGSAYAIRPSLIDADGFRAFAENLPDPRNTYQDWPLAVWCAAQRQVTMGYIPKVLFDYRLHQANHSGDARTVEKAKRNVVRTLNTLRAIEEIALRFGPLTQQANSAIRRKRLYYEYMLALYSNQRWTALCGFLRTQAYVLRGDVNPWKEYTRFVVVQLLGMDGFVQRLNKP